MHDVKERLRNTSVDKEESKFRCASGEIETK